MSSQPGTDLVHVVNPATGTALELANEATDVLAKERREVVELKRDLDAYASVLDAEMVRRLDAMNMRSARVGLYSVETKAPSVVDYPVDALSAALDSLIAAGKLAAEVKDRVLVPQEPPAPKVSRTEINKLLKHSDQDVRKTVLECGVENPQRRTVRVELA